MLSNAFITMHGIREFHAAGVRHIMLDLLGPYEQRDDQIARFASEAMPLLCDLTQ